MHRYVPKLGPVRPPLAGVRLRSELDDEIASENRAISRIEEAVIYARGTTMWHGVRVVAQDGITTLCGLRLAEPRLARRARAVFLCRNCTVAIARSGPAVGA